MYKQCLPIICFCNHVSSEYSVMATDNALSFKSLKFTQNSIIAISLKSSIYHHKPHRKGTAGE